MAPKSSSEAQLMDSIIERFWSPQGLLKPFPEDLMKAKDFDTIAPPFPRLPPDLYAKLSPHHRAELARWNTVFDALRLDAFKTSEEQPDAERIALQKHLRASVFINLTARVADMLGQRLDTRLLVQDSNSGSAWTNIVNKAIVPLPKKPRWGTYAAADSKPLVAVAQKNASAPPKNAAGRGRSAQQQKRPRFGGHAEHTSKNGKH